MDDLTDRAAVNMAVAEAMGWERRDNTKEPPYCRWVRHLPATAPGWMWPVSHDVPDYLGDDPRLNDEMEKALRAVPKVLYIAVRDFTPCLEDMPGIPYAVRLAFTSVQDDIYVSGNSKAEALVRALIAAEIVKLPAKEKAGVSPRLRCAGCGAFDPEDIQPDDPSSHARYVCGPIGDGIEGVRCGPVQAVCEDGTPWPPPCATAGPDHPER